MPQIGNGRRNAAALSLLIIGSTFLLATEQVLGAVADAQTDALVDVHELRPLPESVAPVSASPVQAATLTGDFEELVQPATVAAIAPTVEPAPEPTVAPKSALFEAGIASTYGEGDGFEGNRTACGQVFHTNVVQIAHKSLPCGTAVRVEDTDTGLSVDAVVTDRGPYVTGRIVDLSWGAFKQLHPAGPGLLHVNVYLLDK
jgi:rare lipoprotein A (peptidoglycan hydrolase)